MNVRSSCLAVLALSTAVACKEESDPPNLPTLQGLTATCEFVERTWLLTQVEFVARDADGVADLEPPNVIVEDVVSLDAADFDISPADDGQSATYRWSYRPDGDAFYCGAEGDSPGTLLKLFVSIEDKAGFIAQLKVRSKPL
jgi:hypothetical protein